MTGFAILQSEYVHRTLLCFILECKFSLWNGLFVRGAKRGGGSSSMNRYVGKSNKRGNNNKVTLLWVVWQAWDFRVCFNFE